MKERLIIFVKNPALGRAKTRLAATVGDLCALEVYKRLLERTRDISVQVKVERVVYYDQFIDRSDVWSNADFLKAIQTTGNLGVKMKAAFEEAFDAGAARVCIIGSDCYDLNPELIARAFEELKQHDVVIGPSYDGGYYLLGMNQPISEIFENKEWSTSSVCAATEADLNHLGYSVAKLQTLSDVDTEADLGEWAADILKVHRA